MSDPTYPLFSVFAFLGFVLTLIPLPWHVQAWNSGTCFYMMWASLACLNQFINSVIWAGNALNPVPIWCDISIRIMMGASVGLPAASLCINRRLYQIASIQAVIVTRPEKLRAIIIDSLICVLFPLIYVALQYIVQGHRFNIFEDIGCYPALYNTLPTYFISNMWPIVLGLVSAVYCSLSLRSFTRRRAQFNQFLSSNKSLTISRYFRLMALAMTEIVFTIPLAIFMIWLNATAAPIGPWRSFADTHFAFSRVEQIPAVIWRGNPTLVMAMEFTRWVTPLCAIVFFAFFGFADEAKKHYRLVFLGIATCVGFKHQSPKGVASVGHYHRSKAPMMALPGSLPAYMPPPSSVIPLHHLKRPSSLTSSFAQTIDNKSTDNISTRFSSPISLHCNPPDVKDVTDIGMDGYDNLLHHSHFYQRESESHPDSPSSSIQ